MVWRSPGQGGCYGKKTNKDDFEKSFNIPFEKLGELHSRRNNNCDNDNWGKIEEWSEKYDNAIGNYFKNYLPE